MCCVHPQIRVIRGALDLTSKTAITCMTGLEKVRLPSPPL